MARELLDKNRLNDNDDTVGKDKVLLQSLQAAFESISDGLAIFDSDNRLIMCNSKFQELYPIVGVIRSSNFTLSEFLQRNYHLGVYFVDRRRGEEEQDDDEVSFEDWLKLRLARHNSASSYTERLSDGRWIEITNNRSVENGIVSIHQDITEWKQDEERLKYLTLHDPLTGLVNRTAFHSHLEDILLQAKPHKNRFALMYIDIDDFKKINDRLGHDFGDSVLIDVAKKIKSSVRLEDVVARLGGDEFAVAFESLDDTRFIRDVAERTLETINTGFDRNGQSVNYSVSIGVAVYPEDGQKAETLMTNADTAMYEVKKSGKSNYRVCSDSQLQTR